MDDREAQTFVEAFQAAWDSKQPDTFVALWLPDGKMYHPVFGDRVLLGRDYPMRTLAGQPDYEYQVEEWAQRGDRLLLQWRSKMTFGDKRLEFAGVDMFRLESGRIREERVFMDTGPIWAALDPSMDRGPLVPSP